MRTLLSLAIVASLPQAGTAAAKARTHRPRNAHDTVSPLVAGAADSRTEHAVRGLRSEPGRRPGPAARRARGTHGQPGAAGAGRAASPLVASPQIVSDDFSAPALNTSLWTATDPLSDAALSVVGTGTADAELSIAIPAGTPHDVWVDGNFAPRIMQPVPDQDFEVEAKFDRGMTTFYQYQGILVQQDPGNLVRFDLVGDGQYTKIFAASFENGIPTGRAFSAIGAAGISPLWLRVKRQADTWTESYSTDGSTFTTAVTFDQALSIESVGIFAGTGGGAPAFTSLTDYFFNTASPIVPEDGVGGGGDTSPSITSQPASRSVMRGHRATFSVTASGTAPLVYQWRKNTVEIDGATGTSYTTPPATLADTGSTYSCLVMNESGALASETAVLSVTRASPSGGPIVSDDFHAPSLNTLLWTVTNPLNDETIGMIRAGPRDAHLSISIPAGTAHDVWIDGNLGPRIMQAAPDADFELETRFDSSLTEPYQIQGILVQQDAENYIRFDFVGDGAVTHVFAATFVDGIPVTRAFGTAAAAGAAPLWLRVKRDGDHWAESFSTDGTTFSEAASFVHPLSARSVGVFAGTGGAGPAFTSLIDYVFNTASPILPEDGRSAGLVSDEFDEPDLDMSVWSVVNPRGDSAVSMTGSQVAIEVPAGTSHDAWADGNFAPAILQEANNRDFEVQAKFDTLMTEEFQFEGIMVLQDAENFLRFDFVRDATRTRVFAARVIGGGAAIESDSPIPDGSPLYLNVKRKGDHWTESYSYDGQTFVQVASFDAALTVTAVGPFAGSAGIAPPAFTARIDNFITLSDSGDGGASPRRRGTEAPPASSAGPPDGF